MMAIILRIFMLGFLAIAGVMPAYAVPQDAQRGAMASVRDHTNTPLVVIRFNQRHVYFQRPLYTAVARALATKPAVRFTMVSVVPTHGGKKQHHKAEANFGKVLKYMREMGVPPHRMTVNRRSSNAVTTGEVHVYVQ